MRHRLAHRSAQRGATLLVAMAMLVAIGLTTVSVLRGALNTDQMATGARMQTLAGQAAQIGLRFCEQQAALAVAAPGFTVLDAPQGGTAEAWTVYANWYSAAKVNTVPAAAMQSADSSFAPATLPRCIVQKKSLPSGDAVVLVTVRGFSPDYGEDANRRVSTGAAVWLQSTLRLRAP